MGKQADLCYMLNAPKRLECPDCRVEFDTLFHDYDIDRGVNIEPGIWQLFASCPQCENEIVLVFRVELIPNTAKAWSYHRDLPAGTYFVNKYGGAVRIRLIVDMRGDWAHVEHVKKDGTRDRRCAGWSGSLRTDLWEIET